MADNAYSVSCTLIGRQRFDQKNWLLVERDFIQIALRGHLLIQRVQLGQLQVLLEREDASGTGACSDIDLEDPSLKTRSVYPNLYPSIYPSILICIRLP